MRIKVLSVLNQTDLENKKELSAKEQFDLSVLKTSMTKARKIERFVVEVEITKFFFFSRIVTLYVRAINASGATKQALQLCKDGKDA